MAGKRKEDKAGKSIDKVRAERTEPLDLPDPEIVPLHETRSADVLRDVIRCVTLRKAGATYAKIAESVGVNELTARKYVIDEMGRLTAELQEAVKSHRQLQLERLNEMLMGYWPQRSNPKFGGMILSIMNKMDALLGIAGEKIDVDLTTREFEKMPSDKLDQFLEKRMALLRKPIPIIRDTPVKQD